MKKFMGKGFLLTTETAKKLYHGFAEGMPIIDYHCHINPQEIAENRKFQNITQAWLGGDHYKWRLMRANGVEEKYITGDADDKEKFIKWAETLERAVGNPLYHWSHLELQRYFDYYGHLTSKNAEEVWNHCNKKLQDDSLSVKNIIKNSKVEIICTTDDPIDSLEWHRKIKEDKDFKTKVYPAWRPDKAMGIEKESYLEYLDKLSEASGIIINSFDALIAALKNRMDFFAQNDCCVSDHGMDYIMYIPATKQELRELFVNRLNGAGLTKEDVLKFKTAFMLEMGREYSLRKWVMQLHFNVRRDNNTLMFEKVGADTGFDTINNISSGSQMGEFLNELNRTNELPKTVIYSLNPNDNALIDSMIGCFQNSDAVGKIQHGAAWWFNDQKQGMIDQMTSLANIGHLGNFIGMLTDSRSFLSYTRHEYFRRILCDLIGAWVENGEYPDDDMLLARIIRDICYNNTKRYFFEGLE